MHGPRRESGPESVSSHLVIDVSVGCRLVLLDSTRPIHYKCNQWWWQERESFQPFHTCTCLGQIDAVLQSSTQCISNACTLSLFLEHTDGEAERAVMISLHIASSVPERHRPESNHNLRTCPSPASPPLCGDVASFEDCVTTLHQRRGPHVHTNNARNILFKVQCTNSFILSKNATQNSDLKHKWKIPVLPSNHLLLHSCRLPNAAHGRAPPAPAAARAHRELLRAERDRGRRHRGLWVSAGARKRSRHRAVILTIHSMQEAQTLCENIGIATDRRLECCGSSLFLRERFGRRCRRGPISLRRVSPDRRVLVLVVVARRVVHVHERALHAVERLDLILQREADVVRLPDAHRLGQNHLELDEEVVPKVVRAHNVGPHERVVQVREPADLVDKVRVGLCRMRQAGAQSG
ncbi:hypothetical protein PybrP1_004956 [[Pythium] brassicae (nom. inval.)]|nr:hypothetical protein PybrP1_004956 [[Pythium] brassicae (nom. inval.)]